MAEKQLKLQTSNPFLAILGGMLAGKQEQYDAAVKADLERQKANDALMRVMLPAQMRIANDWRMFAEKAEYDREQDKKKYAQEQRKLDLLMKDFDLKLDQFDQAKTESDRNYSLDELRAGYEGLRAQVDVMAQQLEQKRFGYEYEGMPTAQPQQTPNPFANLFGMPLGSSPGQAMPTAGQGGLKQQALDIERQKLEQGAKLQTQSEKAKSELSKQQSDQDMARQIAVAIAEAEARGRASEAHERFISAENEKDRTNRVEVAKISKTGELSAVEQQQIDNFEAIRNRVFETTSLINRVVANNDFGLIDQANNLIDEYNEQVRTLTPIYEKYGLEPPKYYPSKLKKNSGGFFGKAFIELVPNESMPKSTPKKTTQQPLGTPAPKTKPTMSQQASDALNKAKSAGKKTLTNDDISYLKSKGFTDDEIKAIKEGLK